MDAMTPLIGLYSSRPQMGKSTVAGFLNERYGYRVISFAKPMKLMVSALLTHIGMTPAQVHDHVYGHLKEEVIPELGVSSRFLQQTVGTEWGRQTVSSLFWVDVASAAIEAALDEGIPVVVDDMRYPNEAEAIRGLGGKLARVHMDEAPEYTGDHASEGLLEDYRFDFKLFNYPDALGALRESAGLLHREVRDGPFRL